MIEDHPPHSRRAPCGAVRRWDCDHPGPSSVAQYTADSFSRLIRRVFGPVVFQARERVDMPLPGDARPAGLTVTLRDLPWGCDLRADCRSDLVRSRKLNHLTIRKYLSLVFVALIALLLTVALWALSTCLFVPATIGSPQRRRRGTTPVMAALWSVSALLGVPLLAALTWRWFAGKAPGLWSLPWYLPRCLRCCVCLPGRCS